MSNSVFQSVINQLKEATDRTIGVIDADGSVIACSDITQMGERWSDVPLKIGSSFDNVVLCGQKTYKAMLSNSNFLDYAVFCSGEDELARGMCVAACVALTDAKTFSPINAI